MMALYSTDDAIKLEGQMQEVKNALKNVLDQIQTMMDTNAKIKTDGIADDAVDKDKINADVAGDGLGQNQDGSLEVNVDDSTIEIDTDTLQVKDGGIDSNKLDGGVTIAALQQAGIATFKRVNHDDTSPVEIVAANSSGEGNRQVLILAIASETASGEPDVDIGETDTTNKFIEDVGSGTWSQGDKFVASGTLTEEKALLATIASAGTAGILDILVLTFS